MATVSISPISSPNGETLYQAVAGKITSLGKTAGQALDALTAQLDNPESPTLLVLQSFQPDKFFDATQQVQLTELMLQWRNARDQGQTLAIAQQQLLDDLVEAELQATVARAKTLSETIGT